MNVIVKPDRNAWANFLKRPYVDNTAVQATVQQIMEAVRSGGDAALLNFSKRFDGIAVDALAVSEQEFVDAAKAVSDGLKAAIQQAKKNIETFHHAQQATSKKN